MRRTFKILNILHNMSNILKWATLDNSDSIILTNNGNNIHTIHDNTSSFDFLSPKKYQIESWKGTNISSSAYIIYKNNISNYSPGYITEIKVIPNDIDINDLGGIPKTNWEAFIDKVIVCEHINNKIKIIGYGKLKNSGVKPYIFEFSKKEHRPKVESSLLENPKNGISFIFTGRSLGADYPVSEPLKNQIKKRLQWNGYGNPTDEELEEILNGENIFAIGREISEEDLIDDILDNGTWENWEIPIPESIRLNTYISRSESDEASKVFGVRVDYTHNDANNTLDYELSLENDIYEHILENFNIYHPIEKIKKIEENLEVQKNQINEIKTSLNSLANSNTYEIGQEQNDNCMCQRFILKGEDSPNSNNIKGEYSGNYYLKSIKFISQNSHKCEAEKLIYLVLRLNDKNYYSSNGIKIGTNKISPEWQFNIRDAIILDGSDLEVGFISEIPENKDTPIANLTTSKNLLYLRTKKEASSEFGSIIYGLYASEYPYKPNIIFTFKYGTIYDAIAGQ